jgi:TP901 family phage tail tape measure protein
MFGRLGTIWAECGLDTTKLDMGVARAKGSLAGLSGSANAMSGAFKGLALGVGLVGGAVAIASIKLAADFDKSMRKVWSLTKESEEVFEGWKESIKEASKDLPYSAKEMAEAFYWIKSDMPDATDAQQLKTLETAARGAVGGVAELEETTSALVQAQNAYGEMRPDYYMDLMNKAVERGSITLQDFVSNQGKVLGSAALADISFQEIAAAVATLTRKAVPADTAFMALNQTIMGFLKPTDEARDIAQAAGVELSLAALQSKGLAGALLEIGQKIPDDQLAELFPNVRSLKAVFPLAATAASEFATDLAAMGDAAGTSARMFDRNSKSTENLAKVAFGKLQLILIDLGEKMLPTVNKGIEALGRIFEGKNEVVNMFVGALKALADIIMTVGRAIIDFKPLLVGLIAAFAMFKGAAIFSGIQAAFAGLTTAGPGIKLLQNVVANLGLGFTASAASIGGFATSLGTIGLAVAPVALALGLAVSETIKEGREAEKAAKALVKHQQSQGELAASTVPLVTKLEDARKRMSEAAQGSAEYAAAAEEVKSIQNEIAANFPSLVDHWDAERNAILRNTEELKRQLAYRMGAAQLKPVTEGAPPEFQSMEVLLQQGDKASANFDKMSGGVQKLVTALDSAGVATGDLGYVSDAWYKSAEDGQAVTIMLLNRLKDAGQMTGGEFDRVTGIMSRLTEQSTLFGGTLGYLNSQIVTSGQEWDMAVAGMVDKARQAGAEAGQLPEEVALAFTSRVPAFQEAGVQAISAFLQGSAGMEAQAAGELAQGLFNTETFTSTGNEAADAVLAAMQAKLKQARLEMSVDSMLENVRSAIEGLWSGPKKQEVQIDVSQTGGDEVRNILDKIVPSAKQVDKQRPKVVASGDASRANSTIDNLLTRGRNLDGRTIATVNILAKIIGSGPFSAAEYAEYLEKTISSAQPSILVSGGMGSWMEGLPPTAVFGNLAEEMTSLDSAWTKLNGTALVGWSQSVDNAQFSEMEQAISDLGKEMAGPQLAAWRGMRAAYDAAKAALKGYSDQIDAHENNINNLSHAQEELNRQLQEHQNTLSKLQQMKIAGEGARADKSFKMQQDINRLQLDILKAQGEGRYNDAAKLAGDKARLEKAKQIYDLETGVKYDEKKRALEKLLDPMKGQEMSYARLKKAIADEIKIIGDDKTGLKGALKRTENQIWQNRNKVWHLKVEFDNASKHVQAYEERINAMAQNFLAHYREMIAAQEELNRQMEKEKEEAGGGRTGSYATGGPVITTGLAYLHAGEYVLSKSMLRAMRGTDRSYVRNVNSNQVYNFHFDRLILEGVQDAAGLRRELSEARLRMAVP